MREREGWSPNGEQVAYSHRWRALMLVASKAHALTTTNISLAMADAIRLGQCLRECLPKGQHTRRGEKEKDGKFIGKANSIKSSREIKWVSTNAQTMMTSTLVLCMYMWCVQVCHLLLRALIEPKKCRLTTHICMPCKVAKLTIHPTTSITIDILKQRWNVSFDLVHTNKLGTLKKKIWFFNLYIILYIHIKHCDDSFTIQRGWMAHIQKKTVPINRKLNDAINYGNTIASIKWDQNLNESI